MSQATEAMLEKVLRAPETDALVRQSGPSLNAMQIKQVAMLMEQTKQSYPNQEIAAETTEMWFPAWVALVLKYGIAAMETALRGHMMESKFFPHPSELRDRMEAFRPPKANVFVPLTRREVLKLCGPAVALKMTQESVESVEQAYGAESAKLYLAKLRREERG